MGPRGKPPTMVLLNEKSNKMTLLIAIPIDEYIIQPSREKTLQRNKAWELAQWEKFLPCMNEDRRSGVPRTQIKLGV